MTRSETQWDAVVVGAGVAGGCISALLADRGWKVLLVERSAWPRETVCGGCLSASALASLAAMGMHSVVAGLTQTSSVAWHSGKRSFEHAIPFGAAVLRTDLDAGLVAEAVRRGVRFMPETSASLSPTCDEASYRGVKLQSNHQTTEARAGLIIACDGLGGTLVRDEPWAEWTISKRSHMGVATTYRCDSPELRFGCIRMCMAGAGYAGQVRIDRSTVHLAAAFDPAACRNSGGPVHLIGQILQSCHRAVPAGLSEARLHGTGKLTRYRSQLGGHRILALGDACGYVEPVTGEGMSWACLGALELNRLLPMNPLEIPSDIALRWRQRHAQAIGRQQRWCRAIRTIIRCPAVSAGVLLAGAMPGLARSIASAICQPKKEFLHDPIGHVPRPQIHRQSATDDPGHRHGQPAVGTAGVGA